MVNFVGKMIVLSAYREVDINNISYMLGSLDISRLNIFCIDNFDGFEKLVVQKASTVVLIKLGVNNFIELLNNPNENFLDYNQNSLYILRDSDYRDVKKLIIVKLIYG